MVGESFLGQLGQEDRMVGAFPAHPALLNTPSPAFPLGPVLQGRRPSESEGRRVSPAFKSNNCAQCHSEPAMFGGVDQPWRGCENSQFRTQKKKEQNIEMQRFMKEKDSLRKGNWKPRKQNIQKTAMHHA